jgi:predicted transcriptional regulator
MNKEAAISFRLDNKTISELDRLADLQGIARTAIIRSAIAKHLRVQPLEARSDISKRETRSDEFRSSLDDAQASRIDLVEAELGELECLISDLYRLYDRSVDSSFLIEAAIQKLVIEINEQNANG